MENVAFESTMPFNGYESDSAGWPWLERSEPPGVLQRGTSNRPWLPSLRSVQPRPPVWLSPTPGRSMRLAVGSGQTEDRALRRFAERGAGVECVVFAEDF